MPASEIADQLGSAKVANVILLGALIELTAELPLATATVVLETTVKNAKLLELNRRALQAGREFVASSRVPVLS